MSEQNYSSYASGEERRPRCPQRLRPAVRRRAPPPEKGAAVQPDSLTLGGGTAALAAVFVPAAPPRWWGLRRRLASPSPSGAAALFSPGLASASLGCAGLLSCLGGRGRPSFFSGPWPRPWAARPLSAFGSPLRRPPRMPAAWLAVAAAGCADLLPHGRLFQLRVHIEGRHQGRGLLPELLRLLRLHIAGGRSGMAMPSRLPLPLRRTHTSQL